ncbi:Hpt domain-containing protein [Sabulicella glaciei]
MDDLLVDFLTETREGLQSLDGALLQLERSPGDRQTLSEVFRIVHTVKGTCGFLGLSRLERVAHAAENVLGLWRDGTLAVSSAGITAILSAVDRIRTIVEGLEATGSEPEGDDSALQAALEATAAGEALQPTPRLPPKHQSPRQRSRKEPAPPARRNPSASRWTCWKT